jgi:hypothetical protein
MKPILKKLKKEEVAHLNDLFLKSKILKAL